MDHHPAPVAKGRTTSGDPVSGAPAPATPGAAASCTEPGWPQCDSPEQLLAVLRASVYAGCDPLVLAKVVAFCQAAGLDPLLKPVHVLPLRDRDTGEVVPTIVPGIGLYRTIAARCGCAGIEEPEFGPEVSEPVGSHTIRYPHWCRLRVHRQLACGAIVSFTAREYWSENVSMQPGEDGLLEPTEVWRRRPFGQLAKCTEAQALRKAFPEIGAQPVLEELEGKLFAAAAPLASGAVPPIAMPSPRATPSPAAGQGVATAAPGRGADAPSHPESVLPGAPGGQASRAPAQLELVASAPAAASSHTRRNAQRPGPQATTEGPAGPAALAQDSACGRAASLAGAPADADRASAPVRSLRAAPQAARRLEGAPVEQAGAAAVSASPAKPSAEAPATPAFASGPGAGLLATPGELAYVRRRIELKGLSIEAALAAAALEPRGTLEGLTQTGFCALLAVTA